MGIVDNAEKGEELPPSERGVQHSKEWHDYLLRIGMCEEDIIWPATSESDKENVDHILKNPHDVRNMYGESDLSKIALFKAAKGYTNYGYWCPTARELTDEDRFNASEGLYRLVAEKSGLHSGSVIAELGCGKGVGCRFIVEHYTPKKLTGVDLTPEQIDRAKQNAQDILAADSNVDFSLLVGNSESKLFAPGSLTNIISVESAQHIQSMESFVQNAAGALQPGGKLVFCAPFPASDEGLAAMRVLVPDFPTHCSQFSHPKVLSILKKHFTHVSSFSIGKKVFPYVEQWLIKVGYQAQWSMVWPALHRAGYFDYYVFEAETENDAG